jgi:hypothetical protein
VDDKLAAILKALEDYPPSGEDFSFIDVFVLGSITEGNVHDVLKLMSQRPELNRAFWKMINGAPSSEEAWGSIFWIGSDMSEEQQNRNRGRLRSAVEIVRSALGNAQVRRNALFGGRP